ncbi:hypothetical protein AVDCRST_MAG82-3279 [uncultured Rubrobacteraceae bacterium]|uniref:Uncharacterized protein n=1 Tax=uncultured Rubrobacteraceae bacterium TaxID=349277 RepID=A0A6J4QIR0_9ACTN|nr:hypothetical protein AVDCRST_MAG82-3279 [uncultured Rubrobacteraceae bacterium]
MGGSSPLCGFKAADLTGSDATQVESKVRVPLYSASKAAVTMLTVQYAKQLPEMRVNAADPGVYIRAVACLGDCV